ncbi:MAG TPA: hypothetical protein VIP09_10180 [Dehalococcoidia bacterium]|jgi:high-affinity Fe2+/Pb2+ permease
MSAHVEANSVQPTAKRTGNFTARIRSLPVVSWVIGDRDSAAAGAGCGLVGGACCAGGALLTGLGISSSAAVSAFIGDTQMYFIAASVLMMGAWIFCVARRVNFKMQTLAPMLIRQGTRMGVIYGALLLASMGLAGLAGVSM